MEYFTITLKENSDKGLGLLTEKLTDGFHIDERITVGRGTVLVLKKYVEKAEYSIRNQPCDPEGRIARHNSLMATAQDIPF